MGRAKHTLKIIIQLLEWGKVPAFFVVVGLGFISLITSNSFPIRMPFKPFVVISGSMRPTIPEGSVAFVNRQSDEAKVGDIITFMRPDNTQENVTHRVEGVEEKEGKIFYKTKGDANNASDAWRVKREAVWGTVMFHVPWLGYLISFTRTKPGVLLIVVLPLIVIAIDELRVIFQEINKIRKKKEMKDTSSSASAIALLLLVSYGFFASSIGTTISGFTDTTTATNHEVATSCWVAPSAVSQLLPLNNAATNATDVSFSWSSTTSSCPIATIEYNVQVYSDAGLTTLSYESGYGAGLSGTFLSVPEGEYWWVVLAKDQFPNVSTSSSRHLIVDRTLPLASLEVEGSGYKAVEEKISNGDFESGDLSGWGTFGSLSVLSSDTVSTPTTTVTPYEGSKMVRIGSKAVSTAGRFVWENRLMQSITSGAKSMSLYYNFFTRDTAFDDPGFFIRLNGQTIFSKSAAELTGSLGSARSTGWQQFAYNLSLVTDPMTNLAFYAGNTGDKLNQSWVYLDKITTYYVTARGTADYSLAGNDTLSGVSFCEYKEGAGIVWTTFSSAFQIPLPGAHDLSYRCVDNAGNIGATSLVKVITDVLSPETISDLGVTASTYNSATLQWTAPGNDGALSTTRSSSYDVRYSTADITDDATFNAATVVENVPAPKPVGETESLEVLGLDPSTPYYFAVKTKDEAPNTSLLSNVPSITTLPGSAVNPGDIVINELMWSGSSLSANDEWIELKNMTDRPLDLTGMSMTRLAGGVDTSMIPASSFAGKTLAAHGYFLISNFASSASRMKDTITPDIVNTGVNLANGALEIKLFSGATFIDTAWDGTAAREGIFNSAAGKYYSMERTGVPGDGANPLSWYTCIDSASSTDYFDGGTDERGTPGAKNRSENEPLSHQSFLSRDIVQDATESATISAESILSNEIVQSENTQSASLSAMKISIAPTIELVRSQDGKTVSFTIKDVSSYTSLSYELTYDSSVGVQGVVGKATLSGDDQFVKSGILLGTCSTGGICEYHTDVKNISLRVLLTDSAGETVEIFGSVTP